VEVAGRAYFEGVSGLTPTLELYFRPDMGLHYAWVFPMSEQVANVGVGTTVRQCRQWRLNLREVMHRFLREQDGVRQRFSAARQVSEFQSAQIRAGLVGSPTVSDGIMFVGDAAAVADPFTGEGIHQAMVSGRLAAETATQVLDGSRPISAALSPYTTRLDEVYRERYRILVARARSDTRLYRTLHRLLAPAA
jgi:flavin-dependent dehydrogenase